MTLAQLQHDFIASLLRDDEVILADIAASEGIPSAAHMQVYRNNSFLTLTGILRNTFPATVRIVGDGFFRYITHQFIRLQPPTSGNMNTFGETFPEFIAQFEAANSVPYLPDIARIEWARHHAWHAEHNDRINMQALMELGEEALPTVIFTLARACTLLTSTYPIYDIWRANCSDNPPINMADIKMNTAKPCHVLISRLNHEVQVTLLSAAQHAFLTALHSAHNFEQAYDAAIVLDEDFDLQSALSHYIQNQVMTGFTCPTS